MGLVQLLDLAPGEGVHGIDLRTGVNKNPGLGFEVEAQLVGGEAARPTVDDHVPISHQISRGAIVIHLVALDRDVLVADADVTLAMPGVFRGVLVFGGEDDPLLLIRGSSNPRQEQESKHNQRQARARHRETAQASRSTTIAAASPPPMQMAAQPKRRSLTSSALRRVVRMRAPEAPIG